MEYPPCRLIEIMASGSPVRDLPNAPSVGLPSIIRLKKALILPNISPP
ncbi:hypothetical protein [Escherichia phage BI-EHEC]|nr:hypothetical protein [Escherichia phage BI-EHEC]